MKKRSAYIALIFFIAAPVNMAVAEPTAQTRPSAVESYEQLVTAIRETRAQSRQRIEALVDAEKVREAWETGKLIDEHVLLHKERAEYGKQVLDRLAKDLETSQTELSFMLQFARAYPIYSPANKLSWSHYRELLVLNDSREREELTKQAAHESWTRDQVREEVRRRQTGKEKHAGEILTAKPGKPGTYRVVKAYYGKNPNQLVFDLGFSNYLSVRDVKISTDGTSAAEQKYKEGDIVTTSEIASSAAPPRNDGKAEDLFTYRVQVLQVIDGDTFSAAVDLGFGFTTVQTLRLRGLDAPEIESTSGREAKEFLEKTLAGKNVFIKTVKSDKYDRYLADVFVGGKYVNQQLVEEGLAVPILE